jgi:hypothetical protein
MASRRASGRMRNSGVRRLPDQLRIHEKRNHVAQPGRLCYGESVFSELGAI